MSNQSTKFILLLMALSYSPVNMADDWINPGEETFKFGLGFFLSTIDSKVRVDNTDLDLGTGIDLENDLGLRENNSSFWLGTAWRFSANHRLTVNYFDFSRESTATALVDLEIGEEIFPAGATLTTDFQYQSLPVIYSYSFIKSKKHELAGSFGIHIASIDFKINGDAFVGGGGSVDGEVNAKVTAPLPLFGISYDYQASKRWISGIHGELFAIDIEGSDSSFSGTHL